MPQLYIDSIYDQYTLGTSGLFIWVGTGALITLPAIYCLYSLLNNYYNHLCL